MLYFLQTEIPENLHLHKGLQSIFGLGHSRSQVACRTVGLIEDAKGKHLLTRHKVELKHYFDDCIREKYLLGSRLEEVYKKNCQRLIDNQSYKGDRHKFGYPVRGQRTHTNAKNQKRLHKRWLISSGTETNANNDKSKKTKAIKQKAKPKASQPKPKKK